MQNILYNQIKSALEKEPHVLAVYVVGSVAADNASAESDFDLAVVVKNKRKITDDKIYGLLQNISFPKNLDLSVIDKGSSPLFLFQVVAKGKRIYEKDINDVVNFESFVMHNYYDTQYMRDIYFSKLSEKFNYVR